MIAVFRWIRDHALLYLVAITMIKSPRNARNLTTVGVLETETTSPLMRSVRKRVRVFSARGLIAEKIQFTLG